MCCQQVETTVDPGREHISVRTVGLLDEAACPKCGSPVYLGDGLRFVPRGKNYGPPLQAHVNCGACGHAAMLDSIEG